MNKMILWRYGSELGINCGKLNGSAKCFQKAHEGWHNLRLSTHHILSEGLITTPRIDFRLAALRE
jgi:hypothetical protein